MSRWVAWTDDERRFLATNATMGATALASKLGRTRRQVKAQASYLRISLRPAGETRGRTMAKHEPPASTIPPEVCPHCGIYYVTESCGVCYRCRVKKKLDEYVATHRAALEAAQPYVTEYARQKQQVSRFNRGTGAESK